MPSSNGSSQASITEPTPADSPGREPELLFYVSIASHWRAELLGGRKALPSGTSIHLGRSSSCMGQGVFNHTSISRHHAQITAGPSGLVFEDIGSRNGTTVNGVLCKRAELVAGDVIGLGPISLIVHRAPVDYETPTHPKLLGVSYTIAKVIAEIVNVAPWTRTSVLLRGETGTGKELVAEAIHEASGRPGKLLPVNCATLTGDLLQSEIFGHKQGAFTGADKARAGIVESAHNSSVFLDEVADAPMELQASLLRFLETGETRRVGSDVWKKVDVRVIAASNLDFEERIRRGLFREDLYSRLAGWVIHLPPLRERVEDIPVLAAHFVRRFARREIPIQSELMRALLIYLWPQNVRELKNIVERAVIEAGGESLIRLSPFLERYLSQNRRPSLAEPRSGVINEQQRPLAKPVKRPGRAELLDILAQHKGNVRSTATTVGVSRKALYQWMEEYKIDVTKLRTKGQ